MGALARAHTGMGPWARQMNHGLADGIHPSSDGYAVWADGVSPRNLDALGMVRSLSTPSRG